MAVGVIEHAHQLDLLHMTQQQIEAHVVHMDLLCLMVLTNSIRPDSEDTISQLQHGCVLPRYMSCLLCCAVLCCAVLCCATYDHLPMLCCGALPKCILSSWVMLAKAAVSFPQRYMECVAVLGFQDAY